MKIKTIYIDVLLGINFLLNYFILLLCSKFCGFRTFKRKRLMLAAFFGALFSLVILLPEFNFFLLNLLKIVTSFVIVVVAYKIKDIKTFIKTVLIFYFTGVLYGGIMIALYITFKLKSLHIKNGIVYFHFSFITLIIITVIIYFVLNFFVDIYGKKEIKGTIFKVEIKLFNSWINCIGFLDTGNNLRDVYTGKPVVIISFDKIKSYLENSLKEDLEKIFLNDVDNLNLNKKIRIIPFYGVSDNGLLPCLDIEKLKVIKDEGNIVKDNIVLAVSKEDIFNNEYDLLLNNLVF